MKWEDTVETCDDENCQPYCHDIQAEISFKAGRGELMEWFQGLVNDYGSDEDKILQLKAKLKEWGVE